MFFSNTDTADLDGSGPADASGPAKKAGTAAAIAAQNAAVAAREGVRLQVHHVRSWAAPRLESAADYCTTTVAPRVSAALRSTARQVRPDQVVVVKKRSPALTWSLLAAAVLAAAGAAAALVRYRYRNAMSADAGTDLLGVPPTTPTSTQDGSDKGEPTANKHESPVNGRVSAVGW